MITRILISILLFSSIAYSKETEFHVLDIRQLNMEYWKYEGSYRDPYLIDKDGNPIQMESGSALNMNVMVLQYLYWNNRFHMDSDQHQVRHVGWQWEGGLHATKYIDLFQHHHSQHGLEYTNPRGDNYPLENSYGVRINFINKDIN